MGEAADLFLDSVIDEWDGPSGSSIKLCRHCGKQGLQWKKTSKGWRLHEENGRVHYCVEFVADKIREENKEKELRTLKENAYKALLCLYIAVDKHVADDVNEKVKSYLTALEKQSEN